jgi:hypothetical protein
MMLEEMQKKRQVEPYVHQSIDQVFEIFGPEEAHKKVTFVDFWEQADKEKDLKTLKSEYKTFNEANKVTIKTT